MLHFRLVYYITLCDPGVTVIASGGHRIDIPQRNVYTQSRPQTPPRNGLGEGAGYHLRLRTPDTPVASFRRTKAPVEDLLLTPGGKLVIAAEDGLPLISGPDGARARTGPAGVDYDAVSALHISPGEVWYVGNEAVVRRYPYDFGPLDLRLCQIVCVDSSKT
ncbi:hypothetical protein BD779DRAFT_308722 [Infundibulicybe gibba]|nr:hypothetical protein BD779DRAFT_308722 [Infundibulicybe gibba]